MNNKQHYAVILLVIRDYSNNDGMINVLSTIMRAYDLRVQHQCHMEKHHRPAVMVSCHHSELKEKRIVINILLL